MTIQLFIQKIEKYFGVYENKSIKSAVQKFVSDNWKESDLVELLNQTIKQYPTQYKSQPDVSFFNKIWEERNKGNAEGKAESAWILLEKELKTDKSILCTDLVMQETIISMGGVNEFLDYRLKSHEWCKKEFIKVYIRLSQNNLDGIKILKSNAEIQYPKYPRELFYLNDVKVIGDETQGKIMLDNMSKNSEIEYKTKKELTDFKSGNKIFKIPSKEI